MRRLSVIGLRALGLGMLVLAWPACAVPSPSLRPPPVTVTSSAVSPVRAVSVVSVVAIAADSIAAASIAAADRLLVERVLAHLEGEGAASGALRTVVIRDPTLAVELVPRRDAATPCTSTSWRQVVRSLARGPGLMVVIGGTIPGPTPLDRRAGLACPTPPGVVLMDRRPVRGVDATVVLLHELGHLAGLPHRPSRSVSDVGPAPAPNVMEEHLGARASAPPIGLDDVALQPEQVEALARALRLGPAQEGR